VRPKTHCELPLRFQAVFLYSMSDGWKNGRFELFRCRICGDREYVEVRVQRPSGNWYVTSFFQCVGCTAMFRDPISFSGTRPRNDSKTAEMRPQGQYGAMPFAPEDEGESR
jgi:hypothetical protein